MILPKFCTFCGRKLMVKFPGFLECPKRDQFMSFGTDIRHTVFKLPPQVNYDPYTGERKE